MKYIDKNIKFKSYSMFIETSKNYDWYDWCVFIDENENVISQIEKVEYLLHPSFPNPRRIISTPENRFAVFSNGWGEFDINIIIWFKDGSATKTKYHLTLKEDNWPKHVPDKNLLDSKTKSVYEIIINSDYKWRKLTSVQRISGMDENEMINCVEKLQKENLIRIAPYSALDGTKLIGATQSIGIEPKIKNK